MGLLSIAIGETLEHGAAVITQSRLLLNCCEAARLKSQRLATDFVLAHPHMARRLIHGASDGVGARGGPRREIWRHRSTGNYWIVVTDITGAPESAAGPFAMKYWDPLLRDYVVLDRHHSCDWLSEHIDEFARDDGSTGLDGRGPHP